MIAKLIPAPSPGVDIRRVVARAVLGTCVAIACVMSAHGELVRGDVTRQSLPASGLPAHVQAYGKLPPAFEVNEGQTDRSVRFLAHLPGYSVFLTDDGATISLSTGPQAPSHRGLRPALLGSSHSLQGALPAHLTGWRAQRQGARFFQLRFAGAARHPQVIGLDRLPGIAHYVIGQDHHHWHTNVDTYARVEYRNIYPGINLIFHGAQSRLEWDWVLRPGARAGSISMSVRSLLPAGTPVTPSLSIGRQGELVIAAGNTRLVEAAPHLYQYVHGDKVAVDGGYRLLGHDQIGFRAGAYDRSRELVIDPVLSYSAYLGGSNYDFAGDVAVDASGNSYIVGSTGSSDFPTLHSVQSANHGGIEDSDAFVSKLNAAGTALIYSTYLGGRADEVASGVAVDTRGEAYVTGFTASSDFPRFHPLQVSQHGACVAGRTDTGDAFVARLDPTGSKLIYSTCLGGSRVDGGTRIALDAGGDAYVTGTTGSTDFPTVDALQARNRGGTDAFAAELNPAGSRLLFSTYLGGGKDDQGNGIAVDPLGNVYLAGATASPDFPAVHALQPANHGGTEDGADAFVAKLDAGRHSLLYSTYLGGSGDDVATGVAADAQGEANITGATSSSDFPVANALQSVNRGETDAFVAKLSASDRALVYSTYLGGSRNDEGMDVAVDGAGSAYVTGFSQSQDFPAVQALQPQYGGGYFYGDAFAARLSPDGHDLGYSTYLGGKGDDVGMGIAVDPAGNAYVTGGTSSIDFPVVGPRGIERPERGNAFVSKIGAGASAAAGLPSITIDRVALLHQTGQGLAPTRVLQVKERGLFVVLFHDLNAGSSRVTARIQFVRGKQVIRRSSLAPAVLADGTPYFFAYESFQRKALAGRVVAHVTLTLSSAGDTQSLPFTLRSSR